MFSADSASPRLSGFSLLKGYRCNEFQRRVGDWTTGLCWGRLPLSPRDSPMPPLLMLIDQQQGIRAPHLGPRNHPDAELRMGDLLAAWRQAGAPLLHVRHLSRSPTSVFWPGQPGVQFQPALAPLPGETVFDKQVPDAFANSGLERWLHQRGITSLLICGVASENSVEATARSAGNLDFTTWVAEDACYTFAKPDFAGRPRSAEEVHAMAMANLHGEYATVTSSAAMLERLRTNGSPC